jgi:23S rRNA (cytosine1962-C5)-methyltransferase
VRGLASGLRVLNLFAYTCSFSVAALAGGATKVVNLDMNKGALALGRDNHRDNGLDLRKVSFLDHDLFKSFGKLKKLGPFELIILDPPTDQGASFKAERDWPKMVRRLEQWLTPGGHIVACLNAPHLPSGFLKDIFAAELHGATLEKNQDGGDDFPDAEPDRGLKILHYRWEGAG